MANQALQFTNIINYFVMRNTIDGLPTNDTKVIQHNIFSYVGILNVLKCVLINTWPSWEAVYLR